MTSVFNPSIKEAEAGGLLREGQGKAEPHCACQPVSQSRIIPYLKTTNKLQNSSTSLRNSSSRYFHSFWLHYRIGRLGGQSPAHTGSDFWLHYHIGRPGGASHQFIQVLTSVNFNFCFYRYLNTIKDLQEHGTVESQKLCRTD